MVEALESLSNLNAEQLRQLAAELITKLAQQSQQHAVVIAAKDSDIQYRQAKIDKLTHELATLKRWKFGRSSEQLNGTQISLIEETIEADIAAIELELQELAPAAKPPTQPRQQPKRAALPAGLPRVDIHHEPDSTTCGCGCQLKRIGEDVSEKLDYTPGVFTVEQHIRGKWACTQCQTLIQAPVPAQIIDKGIPTAGLLAQVLVAKYSDHLPLYRQERIFGRAGVEIPRSTLAQWVGICGVQLQPLVDALKTEILSHSVMHADETPVEMLKPGNKKTHRAYLWAYAPGAFEDLKAVVYDFCESRAGEVPERSWGNGRVAWCVMTMRGTRPDLSVASLRLGAWRIQGASSLICMSAARARLPGRLVRISVNFMTWSARSNISVLMSACKGGKVNQNHWPMRFTNGCYCSGKKSRMARLLPKHSITASSAGVH